MFGDGLTHESLQGLTWLSPLGASLLAESQSCSFLSMLWAQRPKVWGNFLTLFSLKIYLSIHSFPQQIFIEDQWHGRHIQNARGTEKKSLCPQGTRSLWRANILERQVVNKSICDTTPGVRGGQYDDFRKKKKELGTDYDRGDHFRHLDHLEEYESQENRSLRAVGRRRWLVCYCLLRKEESPAVVTQQGRTQRLALSLQRNLCLAFRLFGVHASVCGVWGADEGGEPFRAPFGEHSRHNIHIIPSQNRPTSKPTFRSLAI